MRHCRDDAKALTEPEWYAALSVLGRCSGGADTADEWSRPHPGYTPEATEAKLAQAVAASGPVTCERVRTVLGGSRFCDGCAARVNDARSPISLGYIGTPARGASASLGALAAGTVQGAARGDP